MEISIDELITFCEEEEQNHRVKGKRADDASGYTRSKDKNIRTACAIREELLGDYYQQIASVMRKYQKIEQIVNTWDDDENAMILAHKIRKVIEDGNVD